MRQNLGSREERRSRHLSGTQQHMVERRGSVGLMSTNVGEEASKGPTVNVAAVSFNYGFGNFFFQLAMCNCPIGSNSACWLSLAESNSRNICSLPRLCCQLAYSRTVNTSKIRGTDGCGPNSPIFVLPCVIVDLDIDHRCMLV